MMTGFTWLTALAVLGGLAVHSLKQIASFNIKRCDYAKVHWVDWLTGLICGFVLWAGIPEIAHVFPDMAKAMGFLSAPTILNSFTCGFVGNSLADLLGNRWRAIAAGTPSS